MHRPLFPLSLTRLHLKALVVLRLCCPVVVLLIVKVVAFNALHFPRSHLPEPDSLPGCLYIRWKGGESEFVIGSCDLSPGEVPGLILIRL